MKENPWLRSALSALQPGETPEQLLVRWTGPGREHYGDSGGSAGDRYLALKEYVEARAGLQPMFEWLPKEPGDPERPFNVRFVVEISQDGEGRQTVQVITPDHEILDYQDYWTGEVSLSSIAQEVMVEHRCPLCGGPWVDGVIQHENRYCGL